jgi:hypothetical protein
VIWVGKGYADLELALRTHAPSSYTAWHLPLFLNFEMGTPDAIGDAQAAEQNQRLYPALPSIAINLSVILAGFGSLALFLDQRMREEYWWLGLYLLFLGTSNLIFNCSSDGMISLAWNWLLGDLLIYAFTITQVEFTFSFVGRPLGRGWRVYELLLILGLIPAVMTQIGALSSSTYISIQALLIVPAALLLPVLCWCGIAEAIGKPDGWWCRAFFPQPRQPRSTWGRFQSLPDGASWTFLRIQSQSGRFRCNWRMWAIFCLCLRLWW